MRPRSRPKTCLFLLLCLTTAILGGCWDQRPIEELAIIMGIGIDINETNPNLRDVTFSHPVFEESKQSFVRVTTSSGTSLGRATEKWQASSPLLYAGGKNRVLLIGEESAKAGILDLFHYTQLPKSDDNATLAVARGRAEDMLRAKLPESERTAMYIANLIQGAARNGYGFRTEVYDTLSAYLTPGLDPVLPLLQLSTGKDVVEIAGAALFTDLLMVGDLNQDESKLLLALTGRASSVIFSTAVGVTGELQTDFTEILLSDPKTKLSPRVEEGRLIVEVEFSAACNLREYDSIADHSKMENTAEIVRDLESSMTLEIEGLLAKLQAVRSDPLGIGKKLRIKDHQNYDDNLFRELWQQAVVDIRVNLGFRRDGILLQTEKILP